MFAEPPKSLDANLKGKFIFMKWDVVGWELGKVTAHFPKGFGKQKLNYDIRWLSDDKIRGYKLSLESYAAGDDKAVGSWVLLSANAAEKT